MSVQSQAFLIVLAIVAGSFVIVFIPFYWQAASDRRRTQATPDEEWRESGLEELRSQGFELLRAVPTEDWFAARFLFQDETRREIGRFEGISKFQCCLVCGPTTLDVRIDGTSIRVRSGDAPLSEIRITSLFPMSTSIPYQGKTYSVRNAGLFTGSGETREGDRLIASFRRPRIFSKKVLLACRRDLSPELKVILLYLTLIG